MVKGQGTAQMKAKTVAVSPGLLSFEDQRTLSRGAILAVVQQRDRRLPDGTRAYIDEAGTTQQPVQFLMGVDPHVTGLPHEEVQQLGSCPREVAKLLDDSVAQLGENGALVVS